MKLTNISTKAAHIAGKAYIIIALASYALPWAILATFKVFQRAKTKCLNLGRKLTHQN